MRDTPAKEMIAKPALSLRGLVIRTDKRSAKYCSERSSIDAIIGVDLTAHCNGPCKTFTPSINEMLEADQLVKSKKSMRLCFE